MPINMTVEFPKLEKENSRLKFENKELLEALKNSQYYLETAINATPTGAIRNILTDANIATLTAIRKTETP